MPENSAGYSQCFFSLAIINVLLFSFPQVKRSLESSIFFFSSIPCLLSAPITAWLFYWFSVLRSAGTSVGEPSPLILYFNLLINYINKSWDATYRMASFEWAFLVLRKKEENISKKLSRKIGNKYQGPPAGGSGTWNVCLHGNSVPHFWGKEPCVRYVFMKAPVHRRLSRQWL